MQHGTVIKLGPTAQDHEMIHATSANFEAEILGSELPVVIDFWAPWCGPCRAVAPILEKLAAKYAGKVRVAKVNVDEEPELASAFQIASIPTMVAMRGKDVIDVQIGLGGQASVERLFITATQPEAVPGLAVN